MTPFLKHVANDLRKKFGNDLSRITLIFPNKRAGLFFDEYLTGTDEEKPVWAPKYQTINELFSSLSSLKIADAIDSICRIYDLYTELTENDETLDFFYGWGEKLLADFDDVDKNMADVARLFRNLQEIKQLEDYEFVSEEQEQVLKDFFQDFSLQENSRIRKKFLELWNQLLPIYRQLNERLKADGLAYEGALFREVTENLEAGTIRLPSQTDRYVLVGFNVLTKVEERLFTFLQEQKKALFYWDYDVYYVREYSFAEAGTFLRENLRKFPNELSGEYFDNLRTPKDIEFVEAPTENAQVSTIASWLDKHLANDEKRTAIVLCNENLLQSVLHALPSRLKEVNITKGFPLTHTPVFSLVRNFSTGKNSSVSLQDYLEELAAAISRAARQDEEQNTAGYDSIEKTLYSEACFQAYTITNRFLNLLTSGRLHGISLVTLQRLMTQVMRQTSIPFHGEPAVGLQIMGMLETRNLDFDHLLMLSVNEGNLPRKATENSIIPYALRREFGLNTSRQNTAIYAYHFYRLIQRASHIRMVYNNNSNGISKGEKSRFMTQLQVETDLPVRHLSLLSPPEIMSASLSEIPKPDNLPQLLQTLSPSAINTYLRCQLQFYFQRVARLKEPDPPADVIEPNTFGTLFHHAAELIYNEKLTERNGLITAETLQRFLEDGGEALLTQYVRRSFEDNGIERNIIIEEVVRSYLRQLIRHDLTLTPFQVVATEKDTELPLAVPYRSGNVTVRLKGNIDRLDLVNLNGLTSLRVVDYKTGGNPESAKDMDQLFRPSEKHPHYILQTFLYSLTLCGKTSHPIVPALFFVHKAAEKDYSPYIELGERKEKTTVLHFQELAGEFKEKVTQLITEILDPERPFLPTETQRFCTTCPFADLCRR